MRGNAACVLSTPKLPVEHAVVDRFADMFDVDHVGAIDVGDGAGDAEDFVVGAGRETEAVNALFEQFVTRSV